MSHFLNGLLQTTPSSWTIKEYYIYDEYSKKAGGQCANCKEYFWRSLKYDEKINHQNDFYCDECHEKCWNNYCRVHRNNKTFKCLEEASTSIWIKNKLYPCCANCNRCKMSKSTFNLDTSGCTEKATAISHDGIKCCGNCIQLCRLNKNTSCLKVSSTVTHDNKPCCQNCKSVCEVKNKGCLGVAITTTPLPNSLASCANCNMCEIQNEDEYVQCLGQSTTTTTVKKILCCANCEDLCKINKEGCKRKANTIVFNKTRCCKKCKTTIENIKDIEICELGQDGCEGIVTRSYRHCCRSDKKTKSCNNCFTECRCSWCR